MDKVTLLPCPFCGGEGDIESQPSYSQAANTYERHRAWCNECCFGLDWHSHESDAITAWNTRATPALDSEKLREALEEARRQLDYLDGRFPTGTTPAVLAKIDAALGESL